MKITKRQLKRIIRENVGEVTLSLAAIDQHIQGLLRMLDSGDATALIDDEDYDRAVEALQVVESVLSFAAEGGSGAPMA